MPATMPLREMKEIQLEGERLPSPTPDLECINQIGLRLYQQNQALITREIPANYMGMPPRSAGRSL